MQKLAKREEQIMQAVWQLENAFIKEIIQEMPDPKPHYNTIATMVKILEDKGFLGHEIIGNIFRYYPVISKDTYQKHAMKDIVSQYFDNSYPSMLAFFAKEQKISEEELNEIVNLIKSQKK
ncbi:BlaI/MecI/CopY family transcriptional regulator [Mucilaginibacter sp. OK098]|jgi:predicted transcriptional regulator|uniref:BlaI/MecI/CopY family transcriptional regulator n=1 Tax=Mucilaginibacter sp. OK098 TaxID=1855297 RepID=UPI000915ED61|nr:BlaI/MecI/CopY family transcriptional regulator [Mucilaginibacter sp. OK098]SHN13941.1 Predicted transcriptional regulator [Mucilaginibacter sp. OK098]